MAINEKIPVAVMGATGMVGQRFVQLLSDHPWFSISALTASDRSVGKAYKDSCHWLLDQAMPDKVKDLILVPSEPVLHAKVIFSALPADAARQIEPVFAEAGYAVCSNSSAFRLEPDVPLIIPEVNADHIELLQIQRENRNWSGLLVTSPNCTTTGIAMPLKALDLKFGVEKVIAVSMQAVSGAGYPGLSYLDIQDNVIPYIDGEEEKIENETRVLLGKCNGNSYEESNILISAQSNRVPVTEGHTICLSIKFSTKVDVDEITKALKGFKSGLNQDLPSEPINPILVDDQVDHPQARMDRDKENGMCISVGRIRECPVLDIRMVTLVHNTLRGAASGSILNAELLVALGYITR